MKQIPLTKGLFAIVDDEDYEDLIRYVWFASNSSKRFYAKRNPIIGDLNSVRYMHRQILGVTGRSVVIDHINGNSLDNRRCNLRICTNSQNMMNRGSVKHRESEYKGITQIKGKKRVYWKAQIGVNGETHYIGSYDTPEEAATAYNQKAIELHGAFSFLNIISKY